VVSEKDSDSVYDHEAGEVFNFSGKISGTAVDVYDCERRCAVGGSLHSLLYHSGNRKQVRLEIRGYEFSGYDDDTGKPYSGIVKRGLVTIYDSEVKKHLHYSV
jgi:hypothetical protein